MTADQQEPHHHRVVLRQDVLNGQEVALALAHLLAADGQHVVVHPVPREGVPGGLGLRDLGLVVRELQVQAAAVNVEALAQVLQAHGRAFDVPPRKAHAPRGLPAHDVPGLGVLPQREVTRVAFLLTHRLAHPFLLIVEFAARQLAVLRPGPHVEVHAARRLVRVAPLDQFRDQRDLLGDVPGRARVDAGLQDVQGLHVMHERPEVLVGDLHGLQLLQAGAGQHLVLAVVRVVLQVPHVRDVRHVPHLIPEVREAAADHVERHLLLRVPQVRVAVHGRPAQVHAHPARRGRLEGDLLAGQGVVQHDVRIRLARCGGTLGHGSSPCSETGWKRQ